MRSKTVELSLSFLTFILHCPKVSFHPPKAFFFFFCSGRRAYSQKSWNLREWCAAEWFFSFFFFFSSQRFVRLVVLLIFCCNGPKGLSPSERANKISNSIRNMKLLHIIAAFFIQLSCSPNRNGWSRDAVVVVVVDMIAQLKRTQTTIRFSSLRLRY